MRRSPLWRGVAAVAAVCLLGAADAGAQSAGVQPQAEVLFAEGRRLLAAGDASGACRSFAASQKLDPALGTLLNLGDCSERQGKTASAWAFFRQAEAVAGATGDLLRHGEAKRRAAALEPRLSKMTILAPVPMPARLVVLRDAVPVDLETAGIALPTDPGPHVLEASAPGHRSWRSNIDLHGDGSHVEVRIPALQPDAPPSNGQRTAAYVAGGIGVAGLAAGGVLALRAASSWEDAQGEPALGATSDSEAVRDARANTRLAATVMGVGAAGLVTGVVLWWTAPPRHESDRSPSVALVPSAGAKAAGLQLTGAF